MQGETIQAPAIVAGYCSILAIVKDPNGKPMANWPINCKDGTSNYNYTTDEKGQAIFMCNSGAANFSVPNNIGDGVLYIDILPTTYNQDAPVMTNKIVNIVMNQPATGNKIRFNGGGQTYKFYAFNSTVDLFIGGGGGGGGGGNASAGSGGECLLIQNVKLPTYNVFSGRVGEGGTNGGIKYNNSNRQYYDNVYNGGTGGTTVILDWQAIGGNGGMMSRTVAVSPNNGWFGNGYSDNANTLTMNSNVNYGGGGGKPGDLGYFEGNRYDRGYSIDQRSNINNARKDLGFGSPGGGWGACHYTYQNWGTWNSNAGRWENEHTYGSDDSGTAGIDGLGGGGGAPLNNNGVGYSGGSVGWWLCCGGRGGSGTIEFTFR